MSRNQVKNLLDASKEERQKWLDSFDYILTDCDGTVWNLSSPIPGAGDGVTALQEKGKRIIFLSNNSVRSASSYGDKFKESVINSTVEDVIHPGTAAIDYFKQNDFKGLIYLIGSSVLKDQLTDAGFEVFCGSNEPIEESLKILWTSILDKKPVQAVFIDFDYNVTMKQLMKAQIYLRNPDCLFLAGATDMILPFPIPIIGPGAFYKLVEVAANRKAIVVGKPGAALKDIVLKKYNIRDPKRILFIGDTLEQDIGFGKFCGFQTLVVMTGATTSTSLANHLLDNEIPDYYLPGFVDFTQVCTDLINKTKL